MRRVCVCVYMCVCACVLAGVHVCVRICVFMSLQDRMMHQFRQIDNYISFNARQSSKLTHRSVSHASSITSLDTNSQVCSPIDWCLMQVQLHHSIQTQ